VSNFSTEMGSFTPLFDLVIKDVGIVGAGVYGRVWRYCQGERGVCQAKQETIADELGMSRHTILRWLTKLCDAGYLEDTTPDLRNKPHTYRDTGKVKIQIRLDAVAESNSTVAESNRDCSTESHEERSKREEKREEDGADAPIPHNLDEWLERIRASNNRQAELRWMIEILYPKIPEKDLPGYAYVKKVANRLKAGYLAELLWRCSAYRITGDVLAYVQRVAKGETHPGGNGRHGNQDTELSAESKAIAAALSGENPPGDR